MIHNRTVASQSFCCFLLYSQRGIRPNIQQLKLFPGFRCKSMQQKLQKRSSRRFRGSTARFRAATRPIPRGDSARFRAATRSMLRGDPPDAARRLRPISRGDSAQFWRQHTARFRFAASRGMLSPNTCWRKDSIQPVGRMSAYNRKEPPIMQACRGLLSIV